MESEQQIADRASFYSSYDCKILHSNANLTYIFLPARSKRSQPTIPCPLALDDDSDGACRKKEEGGEVTKQGWWRFLLMVNDNKKREKRSEGRC